MLKEYKTYNEKLREILNIILDDMTICKLIKYDLETPLSMPDFDTTELIIKTNDTPRRLYNKILIPDIVTQQGTIVNIFFIEDRKVSGSIKRMKFNITVMVSSSIDICEEGIKSNTLCNLIENLLDGCKIKGLGVINNAYNRAFTVKNEYSCWELNFVLDEFN